MLFSDLVRQLEALKEYCCRADWLFRFVENVACDEADRDTMSRALGAGPCLADSVGLSRVQQPRYFWFGLGCSGGRNFHGGAFWQPLQGNDDRTKG
jgi:hypothetical protein